MPRRLIVLFTVALVLLPAASAHAGWFGAQPLDGPNADVVVGRQRRPRPRRQRRGRLHPQRRRRPARLRLAHRSAAAGGRPSASIRRSAAPSPRSRSRPATANRLAVAWIADGIVYATSTPAGGHARRLRADRQLGGPGRRVARHRPRRQRRRLRDLAGERQRHRRTAAGRGWSRVAAPLDIDPAREAGTGTLRPRVAVSAEGYAVATWGERMADGSTRVFGRRITGMNLSAVPQDLTLPDGCGGLAGHRHRGRRLLRLDRLPPVLRRRCRARVARRLVGSQYEAPEVDRRRRLQRGAEGRHERRRPRLRGRADRRRARRSSAPGSTTTTSRPAGGSTASTASRRPSPRSPARDRNDSAIAWRADRRRRQLGRPRPLPRRRDAQRRLRRRAHGLARRSRPGGRSRASTSAATASATSRWRWSRARPAPATLTVGGLSTARRARRSSSPPRPSSARRGRSCAGVRASTCGARRPIASTWTAC